MKKLALMAVLAASAIAVALSSGSSHREAPARRSIRPAMDGRVRLHAQRRPRERRVVANWIPFEDPAGGPNFYSLDPNARYYINFDNTGDGRPDVRYRFDVDDIIDRQTRLALGASGPVTSLDDPDLLLRQTYDIVREDVQPRGKLTHSLEDRAAICPSRRATSARRRCPNYEALVDQAVAAARRRREGVRRPARRRRSSSTSACVRL